MNKTKTKIITTSRILFNEQGYSNVTIRMIALELKMSSGNLNYHFKKREDILEALYFEMVHVFDNRINQLGSKEITLKTVKEDIQSSLKRMVAYRFFWTDLYNILRLNLKVKAHFEKAYKERYKGYNFLFNLLNTKGIMNDFQFEKESHFLIERMIDYSNTWLYNSFIYNIEIDENYIKSQSDNLIAMLHPYLTDLGKDKYQNLFPSFF